MIGGIVTETIDCGDRIWIDCEERDSTSKSAIYVERNAKSRCIAPGDSVWWQGRFAMWTPSSYKQGTGKCGAHYDIQIRRIGYSGAKRPVSARAA
jgi:hypothetical protein